MVEESIQQDNHNKEDEELEKEEVANRIRSFYFLLFTIIFWLKKSQAPQQKIPTFKDYLIMSLQDLSTLPNLKSENAEFLAQRKRAKRKPRSVRRPCATTQ
jgi:hypothetical protein